MSPVRSYPCLLLLLISISVASTTNSTANGAAMASGSANAGASGSASSNRASPSAPAASTTASPENKSTGAGWLGAGFAAVVALNIASLVLIRLGVQRLTQAIEIAQKLTSSAHTLAFNTIRVGVGPATKRTIIDYAKDKAEFAKLMGS